MALGSKSETLFSAANWKERQVLRAVLERRLGLPIELHVQVHVVDDPRRAALEDVVVQALAPKFQRLEQGVAAPDRPVDGAAGGIDGNALSFDRGATRAV